MYAMFSYDSVTISDGTTTNKYCGTTIPTSISSSTGSLSVNFIADGYGTGAGFEFDYVCNSIGSTTPTTISPGGNSISRSGLALNKQSVKNKSVNRETVI